MPKRIFSTRGVGFSFGSRRKDEQVYNSELAKTRSTEGDSEQPEERHSDSDKMVVYFRDPEGVVERVRYKLDIKEVLAAAQSSMDEYSAEALAAAQSSVVKRFEEFLRASAESGTVEEVKDDTPDG